MTAQVQLHPEGPQPFSVELVVLLPDLNQGQGVEVLAKAHAMCAYSNATKGNVAVKITRG